MMKRDEPNPDAATRLETRRIREAILGGYSDAILGRTVIYLGNLRQLMKKAANEY